MFLPNTLFVLGAASSVDFRFPLGVDLKKQIAARLAITQSDWGDVKLGNEFLQIIDSIRGLPEFNNDSKRVLKVARIISSGVGLCSSIDNFLEMRKEEVGLSACAKIAISSIIAEAERNCVDLQWTGRGNDRLPDFDGKWHQQFAQICFEGAVLSDLPGALSRISVISFNYDRTFEQFVRIAISRLYSLNAQEAIKISNHLSVMHPYGSLSPLPGDSGSAVEFGQEVNPLYYQSMASQIKTFTERVAEGGVLSEIEQKVQRADRIIFLGFGYHRQNIEILKPKIQNASKLILGTAKGVAPAAQESIRQQLLSSMGAVSVKLEDKDCNKFLEEYSLALRDPNSIRY